VNVDTIFAPSQYTGFDNQYIDGIWRPAHRGSATKGLDPYSGKTLIEIPLADQSDVDEALRYNSRFLILPWVRVKDLASSILASASGGPSHLPGTSLHLRIIVAN